MGIKNIYVPDKEDVLFWLENESEKWPASDWDYYVMYLNNDDLIFTLANDSNCLQQEFFLHALYYFVGDYYNNLKFGRSKDINRERINKLLNQVGNNTHSALIKWKDEVIALLSGKLDFDNVYWLHFMFYDNIKKLDENLP